MAIKCVVQHPIIKGLGQIAQIGEEIELELDAYDRHRADGNVISKLEHDARVNATKRSESIIAEANEQARKAEIEAREIERKAHEKARADAETARKKNAA